MASRQEIAWIADEDCKLQDKAKLIFGDGVNRDAECLGDIYMAWDGTDFDITQGGTNSAINVGVDGAGMDFKLFGDTASSYMLWDQSADKLAIVQVASSGDSSKALELSVSPVSTTAGIRQGALSVSMSRSASYAWATWDGNPDCGVKIGITNRSVSGSNGAIRGLDINARNRGGGTLSWINGCYITAEHSTDAGTLAANLIAGEFHSKANGVVTGDVVGVRIYDESQSSTGTSYALQINCTNDSPFAREFCIHINTPAASVWTNGVTFDGNITNALDFADTDGTNAATYSAAHYASLGAIDGKIKIDIGGNTLYIPCYVSIAA